MNLLGAATPHSINLSPAERLPRAWRPLLLIAALALAPTAQSWAQGGPGQQRNWNPSQQDDFNSSRRGGPGGPGGMGNGQGGPGGWQGGPGGGQGGPGGGQGGPGGGQNSNYTLSGEYSLTDGSKKTEADKTFLSSQQDVSAIYVANQGSDLTLINPTVKTTGNTSSQNNSSFHGLNAGVLADKGGVIRIKGGTVTTTGSGANGVFATDKGSSITLENMKIHCTGSGAHGVMTTLGGAIFLKNVDMYTKNQSAAPYATDRGSGIVHADGGTVKCDGFRSPAIYSTGDIQIKNASLIATGAEAAVIEGKNEIKLENVKLTGLKQCGAMIYQSFSGDAEGFGGDFQMEGGSFRAALGPLFFVTNTTAHIELKNVELDIASGVLINAATGKWGRSGSNGGKATLVAIEQEMTGDVTCDAISSIKLELKNGSSLTGKIDKAALTLDKGSSWTVTGDSVLTSLSAPDGLAGETLTNIHGGGHTVTYQAGLPANSWLGGKTYALAGGGSLTPQP